MPLSADKSSDVFSPQQGPAQMEHKRREPSHMEKACHDPPGGVSAAQVLIHHVPGDLHPILPALTGGTSSI
jgi:hypothetical protein